MRTFKLIKINKDKYTGHLCKANENTGNRRNGKK